MIATEATLNADEQPQHPGAAAQGQIKQSLGYVHVVLPKIKQAMRLRSYLRTDASFICCLR